MRLWITLDRLDGTTTVKGPIHPDEIDLTGLLFYLSRADVAGVTFTLADPLKKLQARNRED